MRIPQPNLRFMIHFYTSPAHLYRTVTMYPPDERGAVLDQIVDSAGDPAPAMPVERDQGTVFRIDEVAEVFARNRHIEDLSFEVQVWDPSVLPPPSPSSLPTAKL
ncbi:MAG: hypothetical protein ACOC2N_03260 [Spirochaetota bacterium]